LSPFSSSAGKLNAKKTFMPMTNAAAMEAAYAPSVFIGQKCGIQSCRQFSASDTASCSTFIGQGNQMEIRQPSGV
jgi:hypothetical protein